MAKRRAPISERIKHLRHVKDLTQEELAERSGLSFPTVRHLEYGNRVDPRLSTVVKLARGFGVTLDEFVFGKRK